MLLARAALGYVFIDQAIRKIGDPVHFLKVLREFQLLPESPSYYLNTTAVALPWIELLCGAMLIIGVRMRGAALLVLLMMVSFTTAIFIRALGVFNAGDIAFCAIEFDCGCGDGEPINICKKLLINSGLTLAAIVTAFSRSRLLTLESLFKREP
jgi:uncharacterized membrane protein YphA (DoxX/SURF4 family)